MTFFYNLNKTLDAIREKPELKHGQLNERANSKPVEEGLGDFARKVGGVAKKVGGAVLNKLGHGSDEDMIRDLQKKAGVPQTGKKPEQAKEGVDKQAFAALAPPKDKITFADKIAGAKKEVDEMLGDVAAEAIKGAVGKKKVVADEGSTGDYSAKKARAGKDIGKPGKAFAKIAKGAAERYGSEESGKRVAGAVLNKLRHKGANEGEMDEGFPTVAGARAEMNKRKVGDVTHGAKHDVEEIPGGRRVTRRVDDKGYSVGSETDDEGNAKSTEKRGRGRPKKDKAPERVTAKATKHKGGRKTTEDYGPLEESEGEDLVKLAKVIQSCTSMDQLEAARKMAQNFLRKHSSHDSVGFSGIAKDFRRRDAAVSDIERKKKELQGGQELDEKAVSKKQQKFMGMVHATQKGEKAPSKEVAKVAKTMKKSDAEDFASTKHKGLPEKKKPEGKKKEKTEEAGGTKTPTASSGFSFGQGIYDSMNRELENMIAESMSINMSDSTEGGKSLTVTASDEDAIQLAAMLNNAGIGGEGGMGHEGEACDTCGSADCGCGDVHEALDENEPDWPTNTETSDNALQYAGGLNKPKTTVAGNGQTTVPVTAVQVREEAEEELEEQEQVMAPEEVEESLARFRSLAGIQEAKKAPEDFDKDGKIETSPEEHAGAVDKAIKKAQAEKKVEESIFALTNQWTAYKG